MALAPSGDAKAPTLAIDRDHASEKAAALKKLEELLTAVPHTNYAAAKGAHASMIEDLTVADGESHPASFLTADDVDDYIFSVDTTLSTDAHLPTLAPRAHPNSHLSSHPHLKNPTSVTNWLRKHAPKIFLQDGEAHDDHAATATAGGGDAADATASAGGHGNGTSARKSRGGRGERGGKSTARNKRASGVSSRASNAAAAAAAAAEKSDKADKADKDRADKADKVEKGDKGEVDASMDDEANYGTPVGRGKRKRNDDAGYRPGGSASRPSKKKRKSDADGTPSGRRSKKESAAAAE